MPFYNLGLVHKYSGNWSECLSANQRAVALDGTDEASWWNLGIAATALGNWQEARRAWRPCGLRIPDGRGPVDYPCGITPVRLNPDGEAEVVWSERLDPARAVLRSIPYPSSGFRFGDLVLNDGAPNGYRMLGETEVPVFDCLALLQPSDFSTYVAEVELPQEEDFSMLEEMAARRLMAAEDWSRSVQVLCKACSEGRPHEHRDSSSTGAGGLHQVAIAAQSRSDVDRLLGGWRQRSESALTLSIDLVLDANSA